MGQILKNQRNQNSKKCYGLNVCVPQNLQIAILTPVGWCWEVEPLGGD